MRPCTLLTATRRPSSSTCMTGLMLSTVAIAAVAPPMRPPRLRWTRSSTVNQCTPPLGLPPRSRARQRKAPWPCARRNRRTALAERRRASRFTATLRSGIWKASAVDLRGLRRTRERGKSPGAEHVPADRDVGVNASDKVVRLICAVVAPRRLHLVKNVSMACRMSGDILLSVSTVAEHRDCWLSSVFGKGAGRSLVASVKYESSSYLPSSVPGRRARLAAFPSARI